MRRPPNPHDTPLSTSTDLEALEGGLLRLESALLMMLNATDCTRTMPSDRFDIAAGCELLIDECRDMREYLSDVMEVIELVERVHGVPLATLVEAFQPIIAEEESKLFQLRLRKCLSTIGVNVPTEVAA